MAVVSLAAQSRQRLGKSVRAGRRAGLIPANIVSKGKSSRAIEVAERSLAKVLDQVGYTQPVELQIDQGDKLVALVTDIQFQPAKRVCQHVVFQEIHRGERATVNVPIVLDGESPGVLTGWLLLQTIYSLEVTADALHLPEQITIDISGLTIEDSVIRVSSIKLPVGAETNVDLETPVVRLEQSRAAVSESDEEEQADGETDGEDEEGGGAADEAAGQSGKQAGADS